MSQKKSEFEQLAEKVKAELTGDAEKIAGRLFPRTPPGYEQMPRAQFLAFVGTHWLEGPDGGEAFRAQLMGSMGPKNFKALTCELYGITESEADRLAKGPTVEALTKGA